MVYQHNTFHALSTLLKPKCIKQKLETFLHKIVFIEIVLNILKKKNLILIVALQSFFRCKNAPVKYEEKKNRKMY